MNALFTQLQNKRVENYLLLYGGVEFLNEFFALLYKKHFECEDSLKLYYDEYEYSKAYDYLNGASLFSPKKYLEIRLSKKPLVKTQKELVNLVNLVKKDKNAALLVLLLEPSLQAGLQKCFGSNFCRFYQPNFSESCMILNSYAKELDIKFLNPACAPTLLEIFEGNLTLSAAELNKFKSLSIDSNFIKQNCISEAGVEFDVFFEALLYAKDLRAMFYKLELNEIELLNMLNTNFYKLFKLSSCAKLDARMPITQVLGYKLPPQVENKLKAQARLISLSKYRQIFTLLLECEYELKINAASYKMELLLSFMLKLSSILRK